MANQMDTHDPGAAERAGQVASAARDEAQSVASDARGEVSAVASEAAAQAQNLVDETRSALRSQARQGADRTAGALDNLSSQFRALASGDREGAGELGRYADQASERLHTAAERIGSRGLDGLVDDVQSFARRRPGVFLAVAAASGFVAGRLFRGAQAATTDTTAGSTGGNGDRLQALGDTEVPPLTTGATAALVPGPERDLTAPATVPAYRDPETTVVPGGDPQLGEPEAGR